mmetsp:Transcript_1662/g.3485  ORF Transcript_1662/g.3485 Transcript_1662/m.3485 type:complete len:275 (-) Transcript_1662:506-1330(-)
MQYKLGRTLGLRLCHGWVAVTPHNIILSQLTTPLGTLTNLEGKRIITETQVLRGDEPSQEGIDTHPHTERHGNNTVCSRTSIQDAHIIRQIIQHCQIMLHHHHIPSIPQLGMFQHLTNHMSRSQPLLDIEIGRGFIEHVHIGHLHCHRCNGKSLQLSPTQHSNITIQHMSQFRLLMSPSETIPIFLFRPIILLFENIPHKTPHCSGNMINILRFNGSFNIILQNLGKVILKIRSTKVYQNFLPVGGTIESSQIGFHLSSENFECSRFTDTVGPH